MWIRACGVWVMLMLAMVANGMARLYLLVPWLGDRNAEFASAATAIVLILLITRPFIRSLGVGERRLSGIALLWVGLTVAFEFGFGHWVAGMTWTALIGNYDVAAGRTWPLVLAIVAASPFVWKPRAPRVLHFAPHPH